MGKSDLDNEQLRSKFPFKTTGNIARTALPSRNLLPETLTWILIPSCSILGPILVRNRSTWATHAHLSQNSWLLHGPCAFSPKKSTTKETWISTKFTFLGFYQYLGRFIFFYLFYLIHNSKAHKHSGLFCTKLQVLWFLTLVILLVKHVNLLIWLKFVYKAALNSSIDTHISLFFCIFRALWLVTS